MKLKNGVDTSGVHPLLLFKLGQADLKHGEMSGVEITLSSARRRFIRGHRPSRHSPEELDVLCTAADIRRWALDKASQTVSFCQWLQITLGLGVLLEPDWMTQKEIEDRGGLDKIDPHIHVQLKFDPGNIGFDWTD